ncbi:TonB-dependent receptor [Granulicella sp. S156]|uniref:TonB-dependent receptor n=1 Tax=Granulicella sp. S156 TaxID=1747224 RepID=UPI00131BCC35|nr:carboxypeptidase regulatory-like domain-containing protein [Granulicella sp. S156]
MKSSIHYLLRTLTLMLFGISATMALGQGTSASLTGQVTDPTGAVVPNATVTAKNTDTNLVQTRTTDASGVYLINPLPPGRYSLTIQATGFAGYVQKGITLSVDFASTQNVVLKIGSESQTVTVTSDAELINTTTPELGMTVNEQAISQLPLNGRDPSSLVFLAPGVINASFGNSYLQSGFSFPTETGAAAGGGRQGSTYYLLNGVPNMDTYLGLAAPFPNADATEEFRIITNNFSAAYGFAPGAVVSINTKNGTNEFHGGMFEFLRDQTFNAKNWFSHTVDPLHRNQYGGYVGGPVLKNRLFFFINYQATRSATAATANFTQTPTTAMLNGDFSGLSTNGQETLAAPFHMVNGVPNQINPALFSAAAVTISKTALPLGQQPDGGVYYTSAATINNYDEGTGRLDYDISPSQRIAVSSFVNNLNQPSGDVPGNILSLLDLSPYGDTFGERMQYFNETLSHTWVINPSTVNVASIFWTQMSAHNGSAALTSTGQPFCWSKYINVQELPGSCSVEGFTVSDGGFETGYYEPSQEVRTTYGFYDNFTKTLGRHTLQFGVNIQHQFAEEYTQYPTEPEIDFSGQYTNNGLADFLLGDLYSIFQGAGEIADVAGWQPGFYGQDQFKLRPNITFTAGLRWDPNIAPQIANGRAATFVPGQQSTVYPNAPTGLVFPGDAGIGSGLMATTYGYYEPRLGIAWQPKALPQTSIRAGFGLFTSPMIYSAYNHTADNSPFAPTFTYQGTTTQGNTPGVPLSLQNPWAGFPGTNGQSPFPPFASVSTKPPASATFTPGLEIPATIAPNFKLGTTQSWNISVQQGFGANMVFTLAYVGSESYHQSTVIDMNPGIYATGGTRSMYPAFGAILDTVSVGTSSYNSMQASLERKFSHGLQFQSNLTWSKTIDDASSSNISFGTPQLPNPFNLRYNRGISQQNFPIVSVSNFIYTSPALRGHNLLIQELLGSWEVSGVYTWMSGPGFGVSAGLDGNNNSGSLQNEDRADFAPGQNLNVRRGSDIQWTQNYFNINAFQVNAPGTFGNTPKNFILGPPQQWGDAGFDKNWKITQKYNLQFRWEMFNVFNHPSFAVPNSSNQISATGVNQGGQEGQITSTGFEPARVQQGAIKFTF